MVATMAHVMADWTVFQLVDVMVDYVLIACGDNRLVALH